MLCYMEMFINKKYDLNQLDHRISYIKVLSHYHRPQKMDNVITAICSVVVVVDVATSVVPGRQTWLPYRVRRDISTAFPGSSISAPSGGCMHQKCLGSSTFQERVFLTHILGTMGQIRQ